MRHIKQKNMINATNFYFHSKNIIMIQKNRNLYV